MFEETAKLMPTGLLTHVHHKEPVVIIPIEVSQNFGIVPPVSFQEDTGIELPSPVHLQVHAMGKWIAVPTLLERIDLRVKVSLHTLKP